MLQKQRIPHFIDRCRTATMSCLIPTLYSRPESTTNAVEQETLDRSWTRIDSARVHSQINFRSLWIHDWTAETLKGRGEAEKRTAGGTHLVKAFLSSVRASARLNLASWMTSAEASLLKVLSKETKASLEEVTSATLKECWALETRSHSLCQSKKKDKAIGRK